MKTDRKTKPKKYGGVDVNNPSAFIQTHAVSSYEVIQLALELSQTAHGTIDGAAFETNCDKALDILMKLRSKLAQANTVENTESSVS
jgi:hypothetical protein